MRIVWKIIKLLIGAILGLFLTNKFTLYMPERERDERLYQRIHGSYTS